MSCLGAHIISVLLPLRHHLSAPAQALVCTAYHTQWSGAVHIVQYMFAHTTAHTLHSREPLRKRAGGAAHLPESRGGSR